VYVKRTPRQGAEEGPRAVRFVQGFMV